VLASSPDDDESRRVRYVIPSNDNLSSEKFISENRMVAI